MLSKICLNKSKLKCSAQAIHLASNFHLNLCQPQAKSSAQAKQSPKYSWQCTNQLFGADTIHNFLQISNFELVLPMEIWKNHLQKWDTIYTLAKFQKFSIQTNLPVLPRQLKIHIAFSMFPMLGTNLYVECREKEAQPTYFTETWETGFLFYCTHLSKR